MQITRAANWPQRWSLPGSADEVGGFAGSKQESGKFRQRPAAPPAMDGRERLTIYDT
jgi:hypothetical protein